MGNPYETDLDPNPANYAPLTPLVSPAGPRPFGERERVSGAKTGTQMDADFPQMSADF